LILLPLDRCVVWADFEKDGKLLRLAKRNKHTLPTLEKYQAFHDTFLPLLTPTNGESLVVHTTLVKITSDVIRTLQSQQVVPNTKRAGILNTEDNYGTLLEDLSADPSCLLLDFKVLSEHAYSGHKCSLWTHTCILWACTNLVVAQVVITISEGAVECKYVSNLRASTFKEEID